MTGVPVRRVKDHIQIAYGDFNLKHDLVTRLLTPPVLFPTVIRQRELGESLEGVGREWAEEDQKKSERAQDPGAGVSQHGGRWVSVRMGSGD